ncbi:serine hydrolase domain-containing protein [Streptomyces sp. NPDC051172]|uniref:serine hydrolase domain-containing protein n=1 Tax=Streptomyces sp. NPDC051172 TaxID=3155796 RepID=UPI0034289FEB
MTVRTTLVAATSVALSVALAGPALAAGPTATGAHDATRRAIEAAVEDGVPGVTATAKDAHGTWSTTAGVGDLGAGAPRSARDRYRAGSITKSFVATVLLQLEAEGRLSLDDKVEKWLPGAVRGHGHDGRIISVRRLLNHTSGIFNYTNDDTFVRDHFSEEGFRKHRYDRWTPEDLLAVAMSHAPDFAPGTSWRYSNTNYLLASMVIEKITGHSYGEEIRARIIEPLHLTGTSIPGNRVTLPQPSSRAYSKLAQSTTGPTYDVTTLNPSMAHGSGELVSDAADLDRFYSALLRGRLLPPQQMKEMKTTVKAGDATDARYGLGLIDLTLPCGVHVWGHDGGIHGSVSQAVTTADGRHSLAFNFNADWAGDGDAVIAAEFCGDR